MIASCSPQRHLNGPLRIRRTPSPGLVLRVHGTGSASITPTHKAGGLMKSSGGGANLAQIYIYIRHGLSLYQDIYLVYSYTPVVRFRSQNGCTASACDGIGTPTPPPLHSNVGVKKKNAVETRHLNNVLVLRRTIVINRTKFCS